MQHKSSFLLISTLLLVLIAKECSTQFSCYVCDNCPTITPNTPKETCNEDFFNSGGTEMPSTMTTTETTEMEYSTTLSTEVTTDPTTTMMPVTTTSMMDTTTDITEEPTTAESTEPPVPTPATVGPAQSTSTLPTPPNTGTLPTILQRVNNTENQTSTTIDINAPISSNERSYMNSSTFRVRQLRNVVPSDAMTYHCYSLQLTYNDTVHTQRGCSRVTTEEAVCQQLEVTAANDTSISKCKFCSKNLCNSSNTLGVSVIAMIVALAATLVKRV